MARAAQARGVSATPGPADSRPKVPAMGSWRNTAAFPKDASGPAEPHGLGLSLRPAVRAELCAHTATAARQHGGAGDVSLPSCSYRGSEKKSKHGSCDSSAHGISVLTHSRGCGRKIQTK